VLTDAYAWLGFEVFDDDALGSIVLAKNVEPASRSATTGILEEIEVDAPHRNMLMAALGRCTNRACRGHWPSPAWPTQPRPGASARLLDDTTNLHFEAEDEDEPLGGDEQRHRGSHERRRRPGKWRMGPVPEAIPVAFRHGSGSSWISPDSAMDNLEFFQADKS
jgi:hypothetical protein